MFLNEIADISDKINAENDRKYKEYVERFKKELIAFLNLRRHLAANVIKHTCNRKCIERKAGFFTHLYVDRKNFQCVGLDGEDWEETFEFKMDKLFELAISDEYDIMRIFNKFVYEVVSELGFTEDNINRVSAGGLGSGEHFVLKW